MLLLGKVVEYIGAAFTKGGRVYRCCLKERCSFSREVVEYIGAAFLGKGTLPYRYTVELFLALFPMWRRRDFRVFWFLGKSAAFSEKVVEI